MRIATLTALALLAAAATAGDRPPTQQPRSPKLEWRTLPLEGKSALETKRSALSKRGVTLRRAPEAVPLVAVTRADGSLEIRHQRRVAKPAGQSVEDER